MEVRLYCPIPSPAVFPLPAGAAADHDLCIDQAVVFIEDAIKVYGDCPAHTESALSLCSLLSWGGCLEFRIDTVVDACSQLSPCPVMEAIYLLGVGVIVIGLAHNEACCGLPCARSRSRRHLQGGYRCPGEYSWPCMEEKRAWHEGRGHSLSPCQGSSLHWARSAACAGLILRPNEGLLCLSDTFWLPVAHLDASCLWGDWSTATGLSVVCWYSQGIYIRGVKRAPPIPPVCVTEGTPLKLLCVCHGETLFLPCVYSTGRTTHIPMCEMLERPNPNFSVYSPWGPC